MAANVCRVAIAPRTVKWVSMSDRMRNGVRILFVHPV